MRPSAVTAAILVLAAACGGVAPAEAPTPTQVVPAATVVPLPTTPVATAASPSVPTTTTLPPLVGLSVEPVVEGIGFPVGIKPVPGREAFVVVAKRGLLHLVADGVVTTWIDISDRVRNSGEQGLLDVAFAADFADTGRFFVHYTDTAGDTTISEFREVAGTVDPEGEVVLFTARQPAANHNGGALVVAPDGTLLVGLGDGGGANDRYGNGQRVDTPLGSILRFDVALPGTLRPAAGNPEIEGAVPGLWAFGLRNPWKMTIDAGRLYVADVGQNRFEEVDVLPLDVGGLNLGWPIMEGLHCFSPSSNCPTDGLTLPVTEIAHGDEGTCSVTGGIVSRDPAIPELAGRYLFSDYCGGYLRSIDADGTVTSWTELLDVRLGRVTGFGSDGSGRTLIATADGRVVRLTARR